MYLAKHDPDEAQRQLDIMNGGISYDEILLSKDDIITEINFRINCEVSYYDEIKENKEKLEELKDTILLYEILKNKVKTMDIKEFAEDNPIREGYLIYLHIGPHTYEEIDIDKKTHKKTEKFEKIIELNLTEFYGDGPVYNSSQEETICRIEL